jgi:hypothetical protein
MTPPNDGRAACAPHGGTLSDASLSAQSIYAALGDEWSSVPELTQLTKYKPGTVRRFMPELVGAGVLAVRKQLTQSGRGRPTLQYKKRPEPWAYLFTVSLDLSDGTQLQRVIRAAPNTTFRQLSQLLRACIGYDDDHLDEFLVPDHYWVPIGMAFDLLEEINEWGGEAPAPQFILQNASIAHVFDAVGDWALWHYDFGPDRYHRIALADIVPAQNNEPYLVSASQRCPNDGDPPTVDRQLPFLPEQPPLTDKELTELREATTNVATSKRFQDEPVLDVEAWYDDGPVSTDPSAIALWETFGVGANRTALEFTALYPKDQMDAFLENMLRFFRFASGKEAAITIIVDPVGTISIHGLEYANFVPRFHMIYTYSLLAIAEGLLQSSAPFSPQRLLNLRLTYRPANDNLRGGSDLAERTFRRWLMRATGQHAEVARRAWEHARNRSSTDPDAPPFDPATVLTAVRPSGPMSTPPSSYGRNSAS